jgi:hypothetical protein
VGIVLSTSGASATQAPGRPSTSVVYQTSVLTAVASAQTAAGFPYATTLASSANTASAQPANSNTSTSVPIANGGLRVGAIVGVAISAIALVLIVILVAFLIWRRRRKQPNALPPKSSTVQEVEANSWRPDEEKEVKPIATTNVVYPPELSSEQPIYAANYEKQTLVPQVIDDPRYPSKQLNPLQPDSVYQLSPSSANTELAAVVPPKVAAWTRATSEYGPPYHGVVEADSTPQSRITSPVSELGNNPYKNQHELSASPYMAGNSLMIGHPVTAAQELSSSPAARPAATLPTAYASETVAGVASGADDAEDVELNRMKAEIEAVRAEKERVLHLQALEEKERELSRKIVNRELSKGAGS